MGLTWHGRSAANGDGGWEDQGCQMRKRVHGCEEQLVYLGVLWTKPPLLYFIDEVVLLIQ